MEMVVRMGYKFRSYIKFEENSIGKIILYKDGDIIGLNGNMRPLGSLRQFLDKYGCNSYMKNLRRLTDTLGLHRDIYRPEESLVFGGATAAVIDHSLYVTDQSSEFGAIHPEAVRKCLEGRDLKIFFDEHYMTWVIKEPLEEYLNRRRR